MHVLWALGHSFAECFWCKTCCQIYVCILCICASSSFFFFYLHFTSRVVMVLLFMPPRNKTVHVRVFLWSVLEGVKLRDDVIFHWPLVCCRNWLLSAPLWLQVILGGSEGQEWKTEQVVVTLFPELISSGTNSVGCPGESAVEVTNRKCYKNVLESQVWIFGIDLTHLGNKI